MNQNFYRVVALGIAFAFIVLSMVTASTATALNITAGDNITIGESSGNVNDLNYELEEDGKLTIKGTTDIPDRLFRGNPEIISLVIENGITSIGSGAFEDCNNLAYISIPSSVATIGSGAFANCSALKEITVDGENENYCSVDNVLFNKDKTELIQYPCGNRTVDEYSIPSSVIDIDDYAFANSVNLCKIEIPTGISKISTGCFAFMPMLSEVIIPSSVTVIGDYAFESCTNLSSIVLPELCDEIGTAAFRNCDKLENIIIPDEIREIKDYCFYGCLKLQSVNMPSKLNSIGQYAFANCVTLSSFSAAISLQKIDEGAFYRCSNLTEIGLNTTIQTIANYAFATSALESIYIPSSVTSIGDYAFNKCSALKEITVDGDSDNYCSVDNVLFNKDKTELIQYPCGDTARDFYFIPETVKSISNGAFELSSNLSSVYLPSLLNSIGQNAFANCSELSYLIVARDNENYCSVDNVLFNKDKTELIQYPCGNRTVDEYSIPSSVITIGASAFESCNNLMRIYIPSSVASIGDYAFFNMGNLAEINLPENASLGSFSIAWCERLKSIYFDSFSSVDNSKCERLQNDNQFGIKRAEEEVGSMESYHRAAWFDADGNIKDTFLIGSDDRLHADKYTFGKVQKSSEPLTMTDALIMFNFAADNKDYENYTFWLPSADVSEDGKITLLDCLIILLFLNNG